MISSEDNLITETFNNGRGVDWQPLSEENWEKELEQVPLFMSTAPTEKDIESNETLQAIQSLIYDGTPEEIAANFKEQGNEIVREKERQNYHAAIAYYTKALAQRCADMQLNIACLLNRAQVNLELQNYGSCIRDCQQAIRTGGGELETKSLSKALFRLGKAFLSLDKLEEANSALRYGRKVDLNNPVWPALETQLKMRGEELAKRLAKRESAERSARDANQNLLECIRRRAIQIAGGLDNARFLTISQPSAAYQLSPSLLFPLPDDVVYTLRPTLCADLDGVENAALQWPVCFVYPQMETYDLVSDWHESISLRDQLDQVLAGRDDFPKDYSQQYGSTSAVAVYYPEFAGRSVSWRRIPPLSSLQSLLSAGCLVAEDGIVRFWVMPKPVKGGWTTEWINKHTSA